MLATKDREILSIIQQSLHLHSCKYNAKALYSLVERYFQLEDTEQTNIRMKFGNLEVQKRLNVGSIL